MTYTWTSQLWRWDAQTKGSWFFVSLPQDYSEEIREITGSQERPGFGSVRVEVTVGGSTWRTSLFPSNEEKAYVLPIKKSVRIAEDIAGGDTAQVKIKLVDL